MKAGRFKDPRHKLCNRCLKPKERLVEWDKNWNAKVKCVDCQKAITIKRKSDARTKLRCKTCNTTFQSKIKAMNTRDRVTSVDEQSLAMSTSRPEITGSSDVTPQHLNLRIGDKRNYEAFALNT